MSQRVPETTLEGIKIKLQLKEGQILTLCVMWQII